MTYGSINEDAECSARQIIRHVCVGLKHYFEAHLHIRAQLIRIAKMRDSSLYLSSAIIHNFTPIPRCKVSNFEYNFI